MASPFDIAVDFLNDALEREFKLSLLNLDRMLSTGGDQAQWDAMRKDEDLSEQRMAIARPVKRLRKVRLPNQKVTSFAIDVPRMEAMRARRRQRQVVKASLYAHPSHGSVVRFLVTGAEQRTAAGAEVPQSIEARWDVVVKDDVPALANTSQTVCARCDGMSGVSGEACTGGSGIGIGSGIGRRRGRGGRGGGCNQGFNNPETHPMGDMGEPTEVRRFPYNSDRFKALYDTER